MEMWKRIPDFEDDYEVSDAGNIRSIKFGRTKPIKRRLNNKGYWIVTLTKKNKPTTASVHSLVAAAFLGPRPSGYHCCHNDGNPQNPALSNLRYDTPAGNNADKLRHGTMSCGEERYNSRLTERDILVIRLRRACGEKLACIANDYKVSDLYIHKVCTGTTWKHAPGPLTKPSKKPKCMTPEDIDKAKNLIAKGYTISEVSEELGFSRNQIWTKTRAK